MLEMSGSILDPCFLPRRKNCTVQQRVFLGGGQEESREDDISYIGGTVGGIGVASSWPNSLATVIGAALNDAGCRSLPT